MSSTPGERRRRRWRPRQHRLGRRKGINQGKFREVDPERMGQLVTDVIHAARERRLSLGHEDAPEETRTAIDEFILDSLYADDDSAASE